MCQKSNEKCIGERKRERAMRDSTFRYDKDKLDHYGID